MTRLVSRTIDNSLPSKRVLKELDQNIQKYAGEDITDEDTYRLASCVADRTITNLDNLNRKARESPREFIDAIKKCSEEYEKEQKEREALRKKELEFQKEQYEKELLNVKITAEQEKHEFERSAKRELLMILKKAFSSLDSTKDALDKQAEKRGNLYLYGSISVIVLIYIILATLTIIYGWSIMEPWVYFIGLFVTLSPYVYFALTKKHYSLKVIWKKLQEQIRNSIYSRYQFNFNEYREIEKQIHELEEVKPM